MKAQSEWRNEGHSLKALYPTPVQQEFGKILKLARRASVINTFLIKLQMCSIPLLELDCTTNDFL